MLKLIDGRTDLYQWDTGRKMSVDAECSQVHFSNKIIGPSIDVDVIDGEALIPDILLQSDKDITAWAFVGVPENGYTKISKTFKVLRRNKPADYVFTPPEQTTLQQIMEAIDGIPEAIERASEEILREAKESGEFDGETGPVGPQGPIGETGPEGPQGAHGEDGENGYTPIRGVDYWTEDDKADVVAEAVEAVTDNVENAKSVLYVDQALSDPQKTTARSNISAAGAIVCSATGEEITLTDSSDQRLEGLKIFGKSTQNGTPTPSAPVPIESVGDKGNVNVNFTAEGKQEQTVTIATPNGLPGVPTTSGGNYTDDYGQQWVCDEIDLARGMYLRRVEKKVLNGSESWKSGGSYCSTIIGEKGTYVEKAILCDKFVLGDIRSATRDIGITVQKSSAFSADVISLRTDVDSNSNPVSLIAWLADNNLTVYCALAEPTETPLSEDEMNAFRAVHTNKPNTVVSNDEGAGVEVSYAADTKTYIDNKFAELSAAILNNA